MQKYRQNYGLFLGLIGTIVFSLSLPGTRFLVSELRPVDIGLCRALIASIAAIGFLLYWRRGWPNKRQCLLLLLTSSGIAFGFPILTAVGMQTTPASHGAVILAGMPLVTAIFAVIFSEERPSIAFWLVCLLGLALVIIHAVITKGSAEDFAIYMGDIVLLLAVVFAGFSYALGGRLAQNLSGGEVICWVLVLSLPIQIVWAGFALDTDAILDLSAQGVAVLLFLGLLCNFLGFFFWYGGLAAGGIARVSQVQYLQAPLTVIFSAWLLVETVGWITVGFLCVVIGVVALSRKTRTN